MKKLSIIFPLALLLGLMVGPAFSQDSDSDGVPDDGGDHPCATGEIENCDDNCPNIPNGPILGTCVLTQLNIVVSYREGDPKEFITCTSDDDCTLPGTECQMVPGDWNGNGYGDVCECYADGSGPISGLPDGDVNAFDFGMLKQDWGRGNCDVSTCQGDFNEDDNINAWDFGLLKLQWGLKGCPIVTVWQVVLELLNTNAHLGDGGGQVTVNMYNPDHEVKAIQLDVVDEGNGLTCTRCAPDPYRTLQFICLAAEQENGMCRVTLYTTEPDALILGGEGSILTIDYTIDETAPAEGCTDLTIENSSVSDESLNPLSVYPAGGEICFIACGDVYPREYLPDNPVCGDGVVNLFDELEVKDFILGIAEPSYCQRMRADVPTGTPPYCTPPDGEINNADILVIHDKRLSKLNCCDYYYFGEIY